MTKLCVVRPHLSPYLANNYAKTEKTFSESMGMSYSSEIPNNDDYILITDTHVDINQLSTDQLQRLKLVIHPNSGVDNLNLELLKTCSIPLIAGNPIRANAVAEYILSILPKGTHKYEKFIKPSEFSKILRSNDLIVEDIKGISFNLLANKFFESNNTDINYIIHCKK